MPPSAWPWNVVPFFITAPLGRTSRVFPKASPTAYLNGLRGVACIIVFNQHVLHLLCHWSLRAYGTPDVPKHALQLPVVRVVHAGDGMVSLFFVLSGYVLGYAPLRMIHAGAPGDELLTSLSSSILRRGIRLFTPMLAFAFLTAVVAWALPWYEAPESIGRWRHHEAYNLSAFLTHLGGFVTDALSGIDPFDFSWGDEGKPHGWSHCWTIPHEYRGSLLVYVACLATCKLTSAARKAIFFSLALWLLCSPRHYWEMSCFFGGLFLVETHISPRPSISHSHRWKKLSSSVVRATALLFSALLLSWPIVGSTTQEPYVLLRRIIIPNTWAPDGFPKGDDTRRYLHSIGAFLMLWALDGLPWLRCQLSRPWLLYLGEIAYSFSMLHWMVLYSFGRYLFSYLHYLEIYSYHGPLIVHLGTLALSIAVADLFWRAIDEKSVKLAKFVVHDWLRLEQKGDVIYTKEIKQS